MIRRLKAWWKAYRFDWYPYTTRNGCEFWHDRMKSILARAEVWGEGSTRLALHFSECIASETLWRRSAAKYWRWLIEDFETGKRWITREIEDAERLIAEADAVLARIDDAKGSERG